MGEAIDKMDFIISGCLRVVHYRSLHMLSLPFNVNDVLAYANENAAGGRFGGRVEKAWSGLVMDSYRWNDVALGKGLNMDVRFFGLRRGPQTVIYRKHFYLGNFTESSLAPLRSIPASVA